MNGGGDRTPSLLQLGRLLTGFVMIMVIALMMFVAMRKWLIWRADRDWRRLSAAGWAIDPDWRWKAIQAKRPHIPSKPTSALVIVGIQERGLLNDRHDFYPRVDCVPDLDRKVNEAAGEPGDVEPLPMPAEFPSGYSTDGAIAELLPGAPIERWLVRELDR